MSGLMKKRLAIVLSLALMMGLVSINTSATSSQADEGGNPTEAPTATPTETPTETPYVIPKKELSATTVTIQDAKYTGKRVDPPVYYSGDSYMLLTKGKDYTIKYLSNCKSVGTHTVQITGIGEYYTGQFNKTFSIVPKTPSGFKTKKRKGSSATITWKKTPDTSYYRIEQMNSKYMYKFVKNVKKPTVTVTNKTNDATIYIKVSAVKKKDGKAYTGFAYYYKTAAAPKAPTFTLKAGKRKFDVQLKTCSYHEYQYSKNKNFKGSVQKIRFPYCTSSLNVFNIGSGRWYVRVRTYSTVNGKTYTSSWSKVKSVKVK